MMLFGLHNECPSLDCKSFLEKIPASVRRDPSKARPPVEWPAGAAEKEGGMGIRNYKRKETNIKGRRTASP